MARQNISDRELSFSLLPGGALEPILVSDTILSLHSISKRVDTKPPAAWTRDNRVQLKSQGDHQAERRVSPPTGRPSPTAAAAAAAAATKKNPLEMNSQVSKEKQSKEKQSEEKQSKQSIRSFPLPCRISGDLPFRRIRLPRRGNITPRTQALADSSNFYGPRPDRGRTQTSRAPRIRA